MFPSHDQGYTPGIGTGSAIWVTKSTTDYYEVVGMALTNNDGANEVLGGGWFEVGGNGNIYPSESYFYANQTTWDNAPMVRFDIWDAISSGTVRTDPKSDSIPFTEIVLQGLLIDEQDDNIGGTTYCYKFQYSGDEEYPYSIGDQGSSRPIQALAKPFTIDEKAVTSRIYYYSKAILDYGGTGLGDTSNLGYAIKNSASVGEGIVYYAPANYYHTSSIDLNRWKPFGLCLNAVDANGNDNTQTLDYSGSEIQFTLLGSGSRFSDSTNLASNIFNSNYI